MGQNVSRKRPPPEPLASTPKRKAHQDNQEAESLLGNMVPKKKTYGAKTTTTSSAANAIFGRIATKKEPTTSSRPVLSDITNAIESIDSKAGPEQVDDVEDEIVAAIKSMKLNDDAKKEDHKPDHTPKVNPVARKNPVAKKEAKKQDVRPPTPPRSPDVTLIGSTKSCDDSNKNHDQDHTPKAQSVAKGKGKEKDLPPHTPPPILLRLGEREQLKPLLSAYKKDTGDAMLTHNWSALLPAGAYSVKKIAEASYAEVYRIIEDESACAGQERRSSILKVMRLQSRSDPNSMEIETASRAEDVVSEIRIMNALTEIPGYVQFKGAYIVKGETEPFLSKAWDEHDTNSKEGSYFCHPKKYTKNTLFLVIELGDAGITLDDYKIKSVDEVWDIFLGSVLALAKAEGVRSFEHRDLHENNICVSKVRPAVSYDQNSPPKYGNSGLEVTLIDYGLSRATLEDGETLWYPLENDISVFRGADGNPQFHAYRKMRNHLFTGHRVSERKAWHDEESRSLNNGHTWEEFIPYTNVIWLHYFLGYLKRQCATIPGWTRQDEMKFQSDTRAIFKGMDVRTKVENGAFMSAAAVLKHCVEAGVIDPEQGGFECSKIYDEEEG